MIMTKRMREKGIDREEAAAFNFADEVNARELTQDQAAEVMHVTQATISRWMKGRPVPKAYRNLWRLFWQDYDRNRNVRGKKQAKILKEESNGKE